MNKSDDYNVGYWAAVRDMWILLMEVSSRNSGDIESQLRELIEEMRYQNK